MTAWRWAALGAVATILVGLSFGQVPVEAGCHAVAAQPWIALQDAATADAATRIMDACGRDRLRTSMWLDALAFIPAYTLLLGALLVALRPPRWLYWSGLVVLIAGALADQSEGALLLRNLGLPVLANDLVTDVATAGLIKKLCLALATFAIGFVLAHQSGWRRWAGFAVSIGGILAIAAEFVAVPAGSFSLVFAWLILAIISVAGAVVEGRRSPEETAA